MIAENSDIVALTAQADIHRLYVRIMRPALAEFAPTEECIGETDDMDEFLERARVNTHNALCQELRRTFALILAALFERQVRLWLSAKAPASKPKVENANWKGLFRFVDEIDSSITDHPVVSDLENLHLVANAVRHGNGESVNALLQKMPKFWDETRTRLDATRDLVGNMRIDDGQLERYTLAVLTFWHLAGASSVPGCV